MSRSVAGLIGLWALGLVLAASPAFAAVGYLGAGFDVYTDASLRVREVLPGSPAAQVGMKPGDIVLAIDGQPPGGAEAVTAVMTSARPGQTMSFRLQRGGQVLNVSARLIDRSAQAAPARPAAPAKATGKAASADTKAYCKAMYGKAYMLCNTSDHDCKFLAADKWERCEQTGRWP